MSEAPASKPPKVSLTDLARGRRDVFQLRPTDCVVDEGFNTRTDFSGLDDLKESIRAHGVQSPLLGRMGPDNKFHITNGERRWRAASELVAEGMAELVLPVISEEKRRNAAGHLIPGLLEDERTLAILTTNSGRPLNMFEQGAAMARLSGDHGWDNARIAKEAGCSTTHVANCLRLLDADDEVQGAVRDGHLSPTTALDLILAEPDPLRQAELMDEAYAAAVEEGQDSKDYRLTAKHFTIPLGKKRLESKQKTEAAATASLLRVQLHPYYARDAVIPITDSQHWEAMKRTYSPGPEEVPLADSFLHCHRSFVAVCVGYLSGDKEEVYAHELLDINTPGFGTIVHPYEGAERILKSGQRVRLGPAVKFIFSLPSTTKTVVESGPEDHGGLWPGGWGPGDKGFYENKVVYGEVRAEFVVLDVGDPAQLQRWGEKEIRRMFKIAEESNAVPVGVFKTKSRLGTPEAERFTAIWPVSLFRQQSSTTLSPEGGSVDRPRVSESLSFDGNLPRNTKLKVNFFLAQNAGERWRCGYDVSMGWKYWKRRPIGAGEIFPDRREAYLAGLQELLTAALREKPTSALEWDLVAEECRQRISFIEKEKMLASRRPEQATTAPAPAAPATAAPASLKTRARPFNAPDIAALRNLFEALPTQGCEPERYATVKAVMAFLWADTDERRLVEFITGIADDFLFED